MKIKISGESSPQFIQSYVETTLLSVGFNPSIEKVCNVSIHFDLIHKPDDKMITFEDSKEMK